MKKISAIILALFLGLATFTVTYADAGLVKDVALREEINTVLFSHTDPSTPITQSDIDSWDASVIDSQYVTNYTQAPSQNYV